MVVPTHNNPSLSIGGDEVHVWHVALDVADARLPAYRSLLAPDEVARADRYRFAKDRAQYTICRGVLRRLLERYGVAPAAEVRFDYGLQGKPAIARDHGPDPLRFNVSHSHGRAVLAFTAGRDLGVDVELVRETKDAEGLVDRFFAEEERAEFRSLPADDRARGFFLGWTRKEAFVKATGVGLGYSLESFAVTLTPGLPARLVRLDEDARSASATAWTIADLTIDPDYVVALAVPGAGLRVVNRTWPPAADDQDEAGWTHGAR